MADRRARNKRRCALRHHCPAPLRQGQRRSRPNLRQVHVIEAELIDYLQTLGFDVKVGDLGENVVTRNIDLVGLHTGTWLKLGKDAIIEITGLRAPCFKIERFEEGSSSIPDRSPARTSLHAVRRYGGGYRKWHHSRGGQNTNQRARRWPANSTATGQVL